MLTTIIDQIHSFVFKKIQSKLKHETSYWEITYEFLFGFSKCHDLESSMICLSSQSKCSASVAVTYITLNLHHVFGQFQAHGIRKHVVGMDHVPVVGIGGHLLRLLGGHHTKHVHRGVEGCLGLLIGLLVLPVRLHLGHLHEVHQLGVVLEAPEADLFAFGLFIGLLVFVLWMEKAHGRETVKKREQNIIH